MTPYNELAFKMEDGKPYIKVPNDFPLLVPTGWLLIPQNVAPRAIIFDRILSCVVFFPYDKTDDFCKSMAMKFYQEQMHNRIAEVRKELVELKRTTASFNLPMKDSEIAELLNDKASEFIDSGRYDKRLITVIRDKLTKIHEVLGDLISAQNSVAQMKAVIKTPDDMPVDDFVLADCRTLLSGFRSCLFNKYDWYDQVDFSDCAASSSDLIRFYVTLNLR